MGTVVLPKLAQTGTNEFADVEDNDKALRDEINGNLENVNIKSSAAIAHSKLANITAGYVLMGNASNVPTATQLSGEATVNSSGVVTLDPPAVKGAYAVTFAAPVSLSDSSSVAMTLDTELFDTDTMHSTSANTSRMTCNTAGIYHLSGEVRIASDSPAIVAAAAWLRLNGSSEMWKSSIASAGVSDDGTHGLAIQVNGYASLAVNDYVQLMGYYASIGTGNRDGYGRLAAVRIGPAS